MNNTAKFYQFPATDWDRQTVGLIRRYFCDSGLWDVFVVFDVERKADALGIRIWWYNEPANLYDILRRCAEIRDQVKEQVLSQEFVE